MIVDIHEIKKPTKLPKTSIFIAIKTASGNIGIIDSSIISIIPIIKAIKKLLFCQLEGQNPK